MSPSGLGSLTPHPRRQSFSRAACSVLGPQEPSSLPHVPSLCLTAPHCCASAAALSGRHGGRGLPVLVQLTGAPLSPTGGARKQDPEQVQTQSCTSAQRPNKRPKSKQEAAHGQEETLQTGQTGRSQKWPGQPRQAQDCLQGEATRCLWIMARARVRGESYSPVATPSVRHSYD